MSEQGGCPWKQVASFTSLKPVFSKAQSAVPRQIQGPLLPQCAQQPVPTAAPSVGVPRTKTDAVREATRGAVQDARRRLYQRNQASLSWCFLGDEAELWQTPWEENSHAFPHPGIPLVK